MRTRPMRVMVIGAVLLLSWLTGPVASAAQTRLMPSVRTMDITGEIAKTDQGYIIRGTRPAEIFTVLNPQPAVLDACITAGRIVHLSVRIVSGDNVNIEKIDGKPYSAAGQESRKATAAPE